MFRNFMKLEFVTKLNQSFYVINSLKYSTNYSAEEEPQSLENNDIQKKDFFNKYSAGQGKILTIVNNYNLNELLGYNISMARANKLLAWRIRNGSLKNLNDIFSIEGFGLKVADKFFQSLLLEPKIRDVALRKGSRGRNATLITPSLEMEQKAVINSCVSVRIGVNSITWSRLNIPARNVNSPCFLTHWQHTEISEKKLHLNELIHRCIYVNHLIPNADCYIFENHQIALVSNNPGSAEQQNINIQKAQATGIIGYALASRNKQINNFGESKSDVKSKNFPTVFYMKRFLPARLFNHLVGTERVSSEQAILNMMRTFYNINEKKDFVSLEDSAGVEDIKQLESKEVNFSGRVQFSPEFREMFFRSSRYYREYLGQTLLLNLAFVRVFLLEDSESIATVTRGSKTKTSSKNSL